MPEKFLDEPEFGTPPPAGGFGRYERKTYPFEKLLEQLRENPGRDACIGRWKVTNDMGRKIVTGRCNAARTSVWHFLMKYHPLENWMIYTRPTPDTWGDRELWAVFLGDMTPEEALKVGEMRAASAPNMTDETKTKSENREIRAQRRALYLDYQNQRRKQLRM